MPPHRTPDTWVPFLLKERMMNHQNSKAGAGMAQFQDVNLNYPSAVVAALLLLQMCRPHSRRNRHDAHRSCV